MQKERLRFNEICIFAGGYPTDDNPTYAFIKPVAAAFADAGVKCSVIAPQSITHKFMHGGKFRPERWKDKTLEGNTVTIYQPCTITFSKKTRRVNAFSTRISTRRIVKKYCINPDVAYGHFWHSAVTATRIFPNIPVIAVTGESNIWVNDIYTKQQIEDALPRITGVISVSTENIEQSRDLGLIPLGVETIVLPNAVDERVFRHIDKLEARRKLGLRTDDFIVIFVGAFSERKGIKRVIEAVRTLPDVKLILVGNGDVPESTNEIVFAGSLPHEDIPMYFNAADVFVLPTLAEGCCNAVVEAIACGTPVISSDKPFNRDVLDESCSILIDPEDIEAIRTAIITLKNDDELRNRLSKESLVKAQELTIKKRLCKIIEFINDSINDLR